MTAAPLAAVLLLPLLAAHTSVLNLYERTEVRVRSPGDGLDVEQSAGANVEMLSPRTRFNFGYAPYFTVTDLAHDPTLDLLHTAEVGSEFTWRRVRLTLGERAAYGTRSFTSLTPTTYDIVVDANSTHIVPLATSVRYGSSETSATLGFELSRRTGLQLSGAYAIGGGLDDRARRVIPLVWGPRGSAGLRYQLAPLDALTTQIQAESLYTDTGSRGQKPRADVASGLEFWDRQWAPRTTTELGAGAAFAERNPAFEDPRFFPIGVASLRQLFPTGSGQEALDVQGRGQVDVQIDRLTGNPDHRLNLLLQSNWAREPYGIHAEIGRGQSLRSSEANALTQYNGEIIFRYQWTRPLLVETGYRAAYQTIDAPTTSAASLAASGLNWVAFVALRASAEPIQF